MRRVLQSRLLLLCSALLGVWVLFVAFGTYVCVCVRAYAPTIRSVGTYKAVGYSCRQPHLSLYSVYNQIYTLQVNLSHSSHTIAVFQAKIITYVFRTTKPD